jgi:hypothetical protein
MSLSCSKWVATADWLYVQNKRNELF